MVRALCSHRRGRGFEPLYLYHRFEQRLEAIQKTGSLAQVPLPFSCLALCLALRSVPISVNEIVTLGKPRYSVTSLSLRSLRLSAKRQLSRSCYHFIIDVSTAKRSPSISTSASSVGLKRSKKTGVWHKCHSLCFASNSLIKYHTPLSPAKRFTFARVCRIIFTVTGEIYAKD